jgi:cytochrome c-type biogenesis protein CcmE
LGVLLVAVTSWFAWQGAAGSWQYYLTPDECLERGPSLAGARIRVAGKVAPGSVRLAPDRRGAAFALEASHQPLAIQYWGPLPDLLADRADVVVEGRLEVAGLLRADKLLTRCATKYEPQTTSDGSAGGSAQEAAP